MITWLVRFYHANSINSNVHVLDPIIGFLLHYLHIHSFIYTPSVLEPSGYLGLASGLYITSPEFFFSLFFTCSQIPSFDIFVFRSKSSSLLHFVASYHQRLPIANLWSSFKNRYDSPLLARYFDAYEGTLMLDFMRVP